MFEVNFADIAVGNTVSSDRADGVVTEVASGTITVNWGDEEYGSQTYTEAEFSEYGFSAYVKF